MKLITIDIKSERQTVDQAIAEFLVEVDSYKKGGFKVMKVIHGYGSHGVGGAVRLAFLKKCKELKSRHIIYDYVSCDNWTEKNTVRKVAVNYCPDLIADKDLHIPNPGCSIVLLDY